MVETEIVFKCKVCESISVKWFGQCPNCKEWNTLVEEYKRNNLTEKDALLQARMARILRNQDYDFKKKKPILWKL